MAKSKKDGEEEEEEGVFFFVLIWFYTEIMNKSFHQFCYFLKVEMVFTIVF